MEKYLFDTMFSEGPDRVDAKLKVTGGAKYAAEYQLPGLTYGVIVSASIAKGTITAIDTKKAERAAGVLAVITHLNCPEVPGYESAKTASKGSTLNQPLRVFHDATVYFSGQPIALVIADSFERATYAASLVTATYNKQKPETDLVSNLNRAVPPAGKNAGIYKRGEMDAYKNAPVKIEVSYIMPREVHNPMELHNIIASWDGDDKVLVYEKTQGVKDTQHEIMETFKLPEANVQVIAQFVGGGFGSALRTWPHSIAALIGAKFVKKPLKLVLTREQMFSMVGFRPYTFQKIGMGARKEGILTGITHEAIGETSMYEEFTEGTVNMTKFMYACPNVNTSYKIVPLDISTPTWMRGPGEATGSFALESAMDELSYALNMDPLDFRIKNYAETDPEKNKPFSSKFLKDCYEIGAEKIGWKNRNPVPGSMKDGDMLVGYGISSGTFGAYRDKAAVSAALMDDGTLVLKSAVSDSGPGTATAMTQLASSLLGIPANKIKFELGNSSLPPGPTQGGSSTTSSLGSAVHQVCESLKLKLTELASKNNALFINVKNEDLSFTNESISITNNDAATVISYAELLKKSGVPVIDTKLESNAGNGGQKYSMYSFSVHFVEVRVNPLTGVVHIHKVVSVADAGKVISEKTAASQVIGGVVGGIGMALMEEAVLDHRYGRYVNSNFADYHVPVHADVPHIEAVFVNKPDPYTNPMGSKGLGEIALIGFAAAVANAVYHATGKRVRELPITPDKLI